MKPWSMRILRGVGVEGGFEARGAEGMVVRGRWGGAGGLRGRDGGLVLGNLKGAETLTALMRPKLSVRCRLGV